MNNITVEEKQFDQALQVGTVDLGSGFMFCWLLDSRAMQPEVYGHVEDAKGEFVVGTVGWYRTVDPDVAAQRAQLRMVE